MFFIALCLLFLIRLRFPRRNSITVIISSRYGRQCVNLFRRLEKTAFKIKKVESDIHFLNTCKAYETLPKFLYFKLYRQNLQNSKLYRSWQFKLLNLELKTQNRNKAKLKDNFAELTEDLKSKVSHVDFYCLKTIIDNNSTKLMQNVTFRQQRKLYNLGIHNNLGPYDPNKVIVNVSKRTLTNRERNLLAFGLNFSLPIFKIDFFKYFLSFERLYKTLSSLEPYNVNNNVNLKSSLHNLSMKLFYNFKPFKVFSPFFSKQDFKILRDLSKDDNITICRPDKGRGVVIVDKEVYINKMESLLNDTTKFKLIDNNILIHTLRQEDKLNRLITKFKKLNLISDSTASTLTASGTCPGVMYGLPKTHKQNCPFRPIISSCKSTNYNLAKYLNVKLSKLIQDEHSIKNSYNCSNLLAGFNNVDQYVLSSFDVESLFTNIPLDETINICLNKLFLNSDVFEGFNRSQFKSLLEIATKNSFFVFNNKYYQQIDGVAMGSPLGPTLANVFLSYHETQWLADCPISIKPTLYKRYVDDTLLLFKNHNQIPQFLAYLNNKHLNIKFTHEIEETTSYLS